MTMYKVLLVEDEEIIRKGLMYLVDWEKEDCVVVGEAGDGVEGAEKIRKLRPDMVITDVRMPFLSGLDMLEQTRSIPYAAIVISGYDEFEYAQRAISLDVTEYLLKPVDFTALHKALIRVKEKIDTLRQFERQVQARPVQIHLPDGLPEPGNRYVRKVLQITESQYSQKILLQDVCEDLGVSSVYLQTKFKEEMHYTFHDYLNRYRIQQAVKKMKETDYKVYEIADMVGFSDYKYFIQVFKKYVGMSPKKFFEQSENS